MDEGGLLDRPPPGLGNVLFRSDEEKNAWEYCIFSPVHTQWTWTMILTKSLRCEIGILKRPSIGRPR